MSKRTLQRSMLLLALIPTVTGLIGLLGKKVPIYGEATKSGNLPLDSNLRFFNGVWLGLGITLFSIVKTIEKEGPTFRVVWGCIFLGGVGRLLSTEFEGVPPVPFLGFTAIEVLGAPLFIAWQRKIATTT